MGAKDALTRTRIEAALVLVFVGLYVWENYQLPAFYRIPGIPGPTVFPLVLGIAMALCALWLLCFPGRGAPGEGQAASAAARPLRRLIQRWHFYLMWALLLGYVVWMPSLGFVVSSSLLLLALFVLLGEGNWLKAASLAIGFSLAIHLAFAKGLQIRLPAGILAGLL